MSRPGSGRRIDIRREVTFGGALPQAPFASRLINANYADREIVLAGSDVSAWGDVVGGRDFVQANTSKDPNYGVFTSNPALVFDGVDDFMASPTLTLSGYTSLTFSIAFRFTGGTTKIIYEMGAGVSVQGNLVFYEVNGVSCVLFWRNSAANISIPVGGAMVPGNVYRLIFTVNANAAQAFSAVYLNNVSQGVSAASNVGFANSIHYIGMRAGTSLPWGGKMGDCLIYGDALTAGEVATVDAWLAARCA